MGNFNRIKIALFQEKDCLSACRTGGGFLNGQQMVHQTLYNQILLQFKL